MNVRTIEDRATQRDLARSLTERLPQFTLRTLLVWITAIAALLGVYPLAPVPAAFGLGAIVPIGFAWLFLGTRALVFINGLLLVVSAFVASHAYLIVPSSEWTHLLIAQCGLFFGVVTGLIIASADLSERY